MGKNIAVFGIYRGYQTVEEGVERLREHGFRNTDISVLLPENTGSKDLAHEKSTKAPEGAAAGAGSGAVIGGALGWLAGIGMLSIPGLGPFIAAGLKRPPCHAHVVVVEPALPSEDSTRASRATHLLARKP